MSDLPPEQPPADRSPQEPARAEQPAPPPPDWRTREEHSRFPGVFLDPSLETLAGEDVHSTLYSPDSLLIHAPEGVDVSEIVGRLNDVAALFGWLVTEEPLRAVDDAPEAEPPLPSVATTVVARITVSPDADAGQPVRRPDAWRLLREARRNGIPGLSLNHVITVDALSANPFTGNPFTGNPFTGNPFTGNPFTGNPFTGNGGTAAYGVPGMGGRQPVVYTGPVPAATATTPAEGGRRPVVAVFDTGCGAHAWLSSAVVIDPGTRYGGSIGVVDPATDPETHCSLGDPLDGVMDRASGHGTFIAGVVVQACPDVEILPVRVCDSQGVILEPDLIFALGQLVGLLEKGHPIDVLNLSFSYYHETPDDAPDEGELYSLLRRVREHDCVVVCSAGNDATDRPSSPASLYAYQGGPIDPASEKGLSPQVVVGALNPSGRSVAMFSNVGGWVNTYAVGVSVLSTMPVVFDASAQADLRFDMHDHRRETLDVDDYRAGFAVWSGTSFAAPHVAGRIAAQVATTVMATPGATVGPRDLHHEVAVVIADLDALDLSHIGKRV